MDPGIDEDEIEYVPPSRHTSQNQPPKNNRHDTSQSQKARRSLWTFASSKRSDPNRRRSSRASTEGKVKNFFHVRSCGYNHVPDWKREAYESDQLVVSVEKHTTKHSERAWPWMLLTLFGPPIVCIIVFGAIPIGEPNTSMREKLVYLLFLQPFTAAVLFIVLCVLFFMTLEEAQRNKRSWAVDVLPGLLLQTVVMLLVMFFIYPFTQTFPLMGLLPFTVNLIVTYGTMRLMEFNVWTCTCDLYEEQLKAFKTVMLTLFFYVVLLGGWVIWYRETSDLGQALLPFVLLILVFGVKKFLLAVTDSFPYEGAMLMSGLWFEALDDMFQTLVFPTVENPGVGFFFLWLRKTLENIAYLGFITRRWFTFRVWIKDVLKRFFTCRMSDPPVAPIYEDAGLDDRGHDNYMPGYFRRQMQFVAYKIFSQTASYIFFLLVSPVLRNGHNKQFFPLNEDATQDIDGVNFLDDEGYRNACIFAGASLASSVASGLVLYLWVSKTQPQVYEQVKDLFIRLYKLPIYVGITCLVLLSSQVGALQVTLYHNRIWFFKENAPPGY